MRLIGISTAKGITKGKFLGIAYQMENERYSTSTEIYQDTEGTLTHDITVVEENIEVYQDNIGNYKYKVL